MAEEKTNVQLLIEKGALDPNDITEAHAKSLNEDFDASEMDTIVKMSQKIKKAKFGSQAAF